MRPTPSASSSGMYALVHASTPRRRTPRRPLPNRRRARGAGQFTVGIVPRPVSGSSLTLRALVARLVASRVACRSPRSVGASPLPTTSSAPGSASKYAKSALTRAIALPSDGPTAHGRVGDHAQLREPAVLTVGEQADARTGDRATLSLRVASDPFAVGRGLPGKTTVDPLPSQKGGPHASATPSVERSASATPTAPGRRRSAASAASGCRSVVRQGRGCRAKGNHLPACGQASPNIKGGLDDRAIARFAEQSSGASNHLAIQTSPNHTCDPERSAVKAMARWSPRPWLL